MENTIIELDVKPSEFGINESQAVELVGNLPTIKQERAILEQQYNLIVKLDIDDPATAKKAGELRKRIKDNRTKGIEVWHKTAKEFFLRGGQFVDAIKRKEISVNTLMEETLEQIEKHQEIKEAKRKQELHESRTLEIEPYSEFAPQGINYGELKDDEYLKLFNGAKIQYEAKVEAERKAEQERIEAERKQALHSERKNKLIPFWRFVSEEAKLSNLGEYSDEEFNKLLFNVEAASLEYEREQERIRAENERLAKEKAEIEAKAKAERDAAEKQRLELEAKVKAERELAERNARLQREEAEAEAKKQELARLQAEHELAAIKAKKQEEERLRLEQEKIEEEKRRKEAAAPDIDRMVKWVNGFSIDQISVKDKELASVKAEIEAKFESFKSWAVKLIEVKLK